MRKRTLVIGLFALIMPFMAYGESPKILTTPSGLVYEDLKVGDGATPKKGDTVVVHYIGWLQNNKKKFDSSLDRGQPLNFHLGKGEVIPGWDEGIATMKVGGKRQLIIPASLAYGERGVPGAIPPNATLVFDVELLGIKKPITEKAEN